MTHCDPWLEAFEKHQRPMVSAWFSYAISQGANRPDVVVEMVERTAAAEQANVQAIQAALVDRKAEALAFAETLLQGDPDAPCRDPRGRP